MKEASPEEELRQIRGDSRVRDCPPTDDFAGEGRGTSEPLDISSLVSEMLDLLKVSISKHAALRTSLNQGFFAAVLGNPAQIRQVVMNFGGYQRLGGDRRSRWSD